MKTPKQMQQLTKIVDLMATAKRFEQLLLITIKE